MDQHYTLSESAVKILAVLVTVLFVLTTDISTYAFGPGGGPGGEEAADSAAVAAASGITASPDTNKPAGISAPISAAMSAGIVIRAMKSAQNVIGVTGAGAAMIAYATPAHTATITTTIMTIVTTTVGTASSTVITGAASVIRRNSGTAECVTGIARLPEKSCSFTGEIVNRQELILKHFDLWDGRRDRKPTLA